METDRAPVLASYGAGTNSTALLIEWVNRGLPLDATLFADTGGERDETYRYMEMFSAWLVAHGYPPITKVFHTTRDGRFETLEEECNRSGRLPSIAYGSKKCSGKFKIEPQDKWTNSWPIAKAAWRARLRVRKLVGFGVDERHRAAKGDEYNDPKYLLPYLAGQPVMDIARRALGPPPPATDDDRADYPRATVAWRYSRDVANLARKIRYAVRFAKEYPLIEWGMGRDECHEVIAKAGLPSPGKSACFFCPSSKLHEIRALPPPLQRRALAMEDGAVNNLTSTKGLGRSFSWRSVLEAAPSCRLPEAPISTPCECTDGDSDDD